MRFFGWFVVFATAAAITFAAPFPWSVLGTGAVVAGGCWLDSHMTARAAVPLKGASTEGHS